MTRLLFKTQPVALALAIGLAGAMLITAPSAQATIIFTEGNVPQPGLENILFGAPETGTTITGQVNGTTIDVEFSTLTGETLNQNSAGQANIENDAGGPLTSINVTVPGYLFSAFILNLQDLEGDATITVTDNLGNDFNHALSDGPGQNFLTITTADGQLISNIAVDAPDGFDLFAQPRIVLAVPEPASLTLLGSALLGLGWAMRRRKRA